MGAEPVVLIVEDDPSVGEALRRLLEREGIGAVGATCLAEARRRIALGGATLRAAVVDVNLGEESGLDLVRELARSPSSPSVLVFSASVDGGPCAEAIASGAAEVLAKPATPEAIIAAVRRRLDATDPGTTGERLRTHPSRGCGPS